MCIENALLTGVRIRKHNQLAGGIARSRGMTQLAQDTGLAREGLYRALSGQGNPEFATILKVINALGLRLHAGVSSETRA